MSSRGASIARERGSEQPHCSALPNATFERDHDLLSLSLSNRLPRTELFAGVRVRLPGKRTYME